MEIVAIVVPAAVVMVPAVPVVLDLMDMDCVAIETVLDFVQVDPFRIWLF